ncbi:22987_t:CDS:2 [Rhizophagus irregularis]|nr:22987_t:CDS:2 [Rhizophagus irregularis]
MSELEKNLACDRQKKEIIDYCQQQDNIERDAIAKARRDEAALIGTSVKRLDTCHHETLIIPCLRDDPNTSDDTKDLELQSNKCEVTHNFNLSSHSSSIKPKRLRPAPPWKRDLQTNTISHAYLYPCLLVFQDDWDVIGPIIEKQIPQYVQGAEAFPSLKQMYEKVIKAFTSGRSYSWRFKNLGLVDALKAIMSPEKIEAAIFQNLEKVTSRSVYSAADKVANALRFGVKVGGKPVDWYRIDSNRDGGSSSSVSAVESAIIGITEEEAASVLAVLLVGEAA